MYNNGKTSKDLWAILDEDGKVMWSRGGSSTSPKLLIYESEAQAEKALKNRWMQQVINDQEVTIKLIYSAN